MMTVIRDINRLRERARSACVAFLTECRRRGLDVLVTETLRTAERQAELYAIGRTRPGRIVTNAKTSRHQSGLAWDICKDEKGGEYSDTAFFESCGDVAKSLGITWGGDWKMRDMPHFEVTENWEDRAMDELKKEIAELRSAVRLYRYTCDLPDWARPTVQKLLDRGIYSGRSADDLAISEDMARILVILDRAGVFDR